MKLSSFLFSEAMHYSPRKVIVFSFFVFFLFSCSQQDASMGEKISSTSSDNKDTTELIIDDAIAGGEVIYQQHCAQCHDTAVYKAPHKRFLQKLSPDTIFSALNDGLMQQQASGLSQAERQSVAEYLAGQTLADAKPKVEQYYCTEGESPFDYSLVSSSSGWGFNLNNDRFIPKQVSQLDLEDIPRLKLKWAFAYPNATRARSQPSVAGGAVHVGSQDGSVYALDKDSGCIRWKFKASAEVRATIIFNQWSEEGNVESTTPTAYFGDILANVYAINAVNGKLLWRVKVDGHPSATLTASQVLYKNRLYVPVSSLEEPAAAIPGYGCCTFRGSLVALDAANGKELWKEYTIEQEPKPYEKNSKGVQLFGPSGAPIWNSPTVDIKRNRIYSGTGGNYSLPADGSSDAIIAFDLISGDKKWLQQTLSGDVWNITCGLEDKTNCPKNSGPDFDFAASPILLNTDDGRDILIAGQKSGWVYGLDPNNNGEYIWKNKVGRGGILGGVYFGMAVEGNRLYVPVSDYDGPLASDEDYDEPPHPGLYALDAITGNYLWKKPGVDVCHGRKFCFHGITAAITAIPGAVFAIAMDGHLRAYNGEDGQILWDYDTAVDFKTVNGSIAHGGSSNADGPVIVDGQVYVNSGYGIYFHMPGNVLLAFSVDEE